MKFFCRLCAMPKQSEEFKCKIDDQNFDIEQKLVSCCNWNSYRSHHNLPQNVCIPCFLQLQQCWYFRETIARAQQKFCDLMKINVDLKAIDGKSFDEIQVKEEILVDETVEVEPIEVSALKIENDYENHSNLHESSDDNDIDRTDGFHDDDDNDEVGAEPTNDTIKEDIKPKRKTNVAKTTKSIKRLDKEKPNVKEKVQRKNGTPKARKCPSKVIEFDIKTVLSHEDVNENGTIKPEKIHAQNFCNWTAIKSRCYKCNEEFGTAADLWAHFTTTHSNEKVKFICPICPDEMLFLSGRYYRSHIAKSHFPHLVYW